MPRPRTDTTGAVVGTNTVGAATVITPVGPVAHAEVVMEGATITDVRPASGAVPDVVLVPGFVDLQVNGIGTVDVAVATEEQWTTIDEALLAQGVTTWCPTIVTAPLDALETSLDAVATAAARPPGARPEIAGAHLEGPFLGVLGAHRPEFVRGDVDRHWLESLGDRVRILTLAPELPGALDAIAALSTQGVLVALGHSACTAEVAREAADAGARLVTHLGNAMGPLHQRAPGLLGAALADDRLSVSLIADLVHTHAVFLRMAFTAKTSRGVALVTDAVATTTPSASPRTAGAASARSSKPPRLADGTLAGSALTMERAVSNVVRHGGVTLADAVQAASATPARLLGLDDRGALAPGRRADLVALQASADGGWRVVSVWVAGARAWSAPAQGPAERRAEP